MRQTSFLVVVVALIAACGTSPGAARDDLALDSSTPESDAATAEDGTSPDTTADVVTPDVDLPDTPSPTDTAADAAPGIDAEAIAAACESACDTRETESGGGCDVSDTLPCYEACVDRGPLVDPPLFDAYTECIARDPLCFQSLLQCVLSLEYGEPFAHTVVVDATNFGRYTHLQLYVAIEERPNEMLRTDLRIEDDAFEIALEVFMSAQQSHLVLWYIDTNGDGLCSPDVDIAGTGSFELWAIEDPAIRLPEWRIPIRPDPAIDAGFVCDFI